VSPACGAQLGAFFQDLGFAGGLKSHFIGSADWVAPGVAAVGAFARERGNASGGYANVQVPLPPPLDAGDRLLRAPPPQHLQPLLVRLWLGHQRPATGSGARLAVSWNENSGSEFEQSTSKVKGSSQ
jgi:hypothetical protein